MVCFNNALADFEEARDIAERGCMWLHLEDYHLETARLYLAHVQTEKARENLKKAKIMMEEMGYHRRDGEIDELTVSFFL